MSKFDLERLYKLYPRKIGKTVGMKKAQRDVKTEQDYQDLETAIRRFSAYLRAKGTEPQYIPYFQTFMTSWRDWLDPEAGQVSLAGPVQPPPPKDDTSWEDLPSDPARVRAILDRALSGKSFSSHERADTHEGLAGGLEEVGPDDCD